MITIKDRLEILGLEGILAYLEADYQNHLHDIVALLKLLDRDGEYTTAYEEANHIIGNPDNNWNRLIKSVFEDLNTAIRQTFLKNFIIRSAIIGNQKRKAIAKKEGCNIPWAVLMDPTSKCNLKCVGCWAAEYGHKLSLPYETLERIIEEGKELGTYMYIFSGGEPLMRKTDILSLCRKYPECMFLAFTNGTLIDESFANEMMAVKNFIPAISVEGFEDATDGRRGSGTYTAVCRAMRILKERGLLFGISSCYTATNVNEVGSDAYIDAMVEKGAKFAWYFTYMPIGKNAVPELMVSAEQREYMYHQVRRFRKEKPIFVLDFWNDGEYIDGCIAGGRHYMHINANGDVEPCAFIHYSTVNIKDVPLLDALKSPLFTEYKKGQPFNPNHLQPCPLLDNPDKLCEMVERAGAYSTDLECPESVNVLADKCRYAAREWEKTAARLFEIQHART